MEIDTGASISLINYETFVKFYGSKARINPTSSFIQTYIGEIVKPKGSTRAQVEYNGQKTSGRIIVIDGNCLSLLGRDILRKTKLNWNELFNTGLQKLASHTQKFGLIIRTYMRVGHAEKLGA